MTRGHEPPSLYEWAGGADRLTALFDAFYERVRRDDLLGPLFANMAPDHVAHVAAFVGEVFGGPKAYSSDRGGHAAMVRRHMGRHLTQDHRRRWMSLLIETADAVGLRDDPEFRSAFVGYLEWGTRLAVLNSQDGAEPHPKAPMPSWNCGPTGGPWLG